MSRARVSALVAGAAVALLGGLLLAAEEGAIDVSGGWLLAGVSTLAGVALVASGLGAREP